MAKINDALVTKINNAAVTQAANEAATYYEQNYKKKLTGHFFTDLKNVKEDVVFSSTENTPFTNLLNAIINYAGGAENSYSSNAKDKIFAELPFPQYALGIREAAESGITEWKYVPYELVYPANKPESMSSSNFSALQRTSGSKRKTVNTIYKRKYSNYERKLADNLIFTPDTTGGVAADKLNTVLEERKLVTPDFNMDNEGDKKAVNFINLINNKLPNDDEFRKEFFKYAKQFAGSEFEKYLKWCGYNETQITEYSL